MSYLWQKTDNDDWVHTEIQHSVVLNRNSIGRLDDLDQALLCAAVVLYGRPIDRCVAKWVLLPPAGMPVRINGTPLESGIMVIADRDAIQIEDFPAIYFSSERLAQVESFPVAESVFCPRCKLKINAGDTAVCCPRCNVWHHDQMSGEHNCWSYTDTCALCDQTTDIESAKLRWTPEEL